MSANHEALNGPCPNIYSELNDFITRRHDKVLRPLHFADISLSQFSAELECYLSVLDSGGSIAFCRGEKLASIRLSQRLETLFQTQTPRVLDGPQLTWTTVILAIGPRFDGPPTLRVGESLVEFAEDDLELLKSGAPWRFLNPWPDKGDCTKELQSGDMTLQEINESRQILHQVLDKMSVLEQGLMHHREVVAQFFQNQQHPSTSQEETPNPVVLCNGPPAGHPDRAGASDERASEPLDLNNDRTVRSETTEPRRNGLADSSTVDVSAQHANPQAKNAASQGSRLHKSDFIQALSDALDEPENAAAMRSSDDGRSISLGLCNEFPVHLLRKLSTKSYGSLVRRLYYYRFRKTWGAYHHDCFTRGQPSSIVPTRHMSPSPSPRSMRDSPRGPRIKIIPRKRARKSVEQLAGK